MTNGKLMRALPKEVPHYHAREAAHLRALAEQTTTAAVRNRLLKEAEEHDWLGEQHFLEAAGEKHQ